MRDMPSIEDALLAAEGRVATLTFNRHDIRNELTSTRLIDDIVSVVDWINRTEEISVLVMTGAGSAFSAGGNIKHMRDREGSFGGDVNAVQRKYRSGIQRIPLALHRLEVPSIAAINGHAIGAGFDLACMCDIRLASRDAKMGESFVNLGIIPGDGGAWFLQRLVGYQRAAELSFTGRIFGAEEAERLGLVLEVLEPAALLPRATELARELASKPPQILRLTKHLLNASRRLDLPDALDLAAVFQGIAHNTRDHLEAVLAMLEKRPPTFRGE